MKRIQSFRAMSCLGFPRARKAAFCVASCLALVAATSAATSPWIEGVSAPGISGSADAVALDASGAPVALMRIGTALVVTSREPNSGIQRWQIRFGGGGLGRARGHAIAIAPDGGVVVAGSRQPPGETERGFVAKIDGATGLALWTWDAPYVRTEGGLGHAALRGVVVDSDGNVYVAGARPAAAGHGGDLFVASISARGSTRWLFELDGGATDETVGGKFPDSAYRIVLDRQGNPIVFGTLRTANDPLWDVVLLRLDSVSGKQTWRVDLDFAPTDVARGLTLLANGDVIASTGGMERAAVFRIQPGESEPRWAYFEADDAVGQKWIHDVHATTGSDVFFGGAVENDSQFAMVVGRLDETTGDPRWHRRIGDGLVPWQKALSVELAVDGDLYVGGMRAEGRERRMSLARLDGRTGEPVWETLIPGSPGTAGNVAQEIRVDARARRLYAVGSLAVASSGGLREATLVALNTRDGKAPGPSDDPNDLLSIPLSGQSQLWVVLVDDVSREYRSATDRQQVLRSPEVVTRLTDALRHRTARSVLLFPNDGLKAIRFIGAHRETLARRTAQAEVYVERGSPAHDAAVSLAADSSDRSR